MRPWYRREPWLAVELAAFLPMVAAFLVPEQLGVPLVGFSGFLVAAGLALLIRRGPPPRAHARPDATTGPAETAPRERQGAQ